VDKFHLKLSPAAIREIDLLSDKRVQVIFEKLEALKKNPFPQGKRIKKIKGKQSTFYRLRFDKYRIFYSIQEQEVIILKVVLKKDADTFIKRL